MPKGNQIKAGLRWKLGKQLETDWDNYKRKTQGEIAAELSEEHGVKITRQNISSILRMAGLVQEMGMLSNTMLTREVAMAMCHTIVRMNAWLAANFEEYNDQVSEQQGLLADITIITAYASPDEMDELGDVSHLPTIDEVLLSQEEAEEEDEVVDCEDELSYQ